MTLTRLQWTGRAARQSPVFIVGEARSGTSLLYRCLQTHSAFITRSGLHLVESHAMELLPYAFGPESEVGWELVAFMIDRAAYEGFARDIASLRRRRQLVRRVIGGVPHDMLSWLAAGEHHVVRRYFLGAAAGRGAQRLVEKTPQHTQWIRHLKVAFPRAQFLYVVRHPVDVFASYRRRFASDPVGSPWANVDVAAFCQRWHANLASVRALAGTRLTRVLIVRYEDLVASSEPTVRRILAHLGVPFEEACLLRAGIELPPGADPLLEEPMVARGEHWREHMSVSTARQIEERLGVEMAAFGYWPHSEGAG
jgi:hypothetical protein